MARQRKFPRKEELVPVQAPLNNAQLRIDIEAREKARHLLKRYNEAKNKRQQYVPIWQEVANYTLPYRGGFYDVAPNTGAIQVLIRMQKYMTTRLSTR